MFTSVRIQNFRQFRDLKLEGLGQINLITGANDTGKTSLLEALFLLAKPTNPDAVLTLADLRGAKSVTATGNYAWGFIFRDGDATLPIAIEAQHDGGTDERVQIRVSGNLEAVVSNGSEANGLPGERTIPTALSASPVLEYDYQAGPGPELNRRQSRMTVSEDGRPLLQAQSYQSRPFYFLSHEPVDAQAGAKRFSQLVESRRKRDVVEAMRLLEPRLVDLEVLALTTSIVVSADIGTPQLIPTNFMGGGFERLMALTLAILLSSGGSVYIDEIDDGLHYSVLVDVWRTIIETAVKHSVQVFATTHSWECIEAAVKASEDHAGKLALFRLERHKDEIRAVDIEDEDLRSAVGLGVELR